MTVAELIAKLQTMPPSAEVIYQACSDWNVLDADEVELKTADESRRLVEEERESHKKSGLNVAVVSSAVCYRGGRYCKAYPLRQYPAGEEPVYRDVVTLPGN